MASVAKNVGKDVSKNVSTNLAGPVSDPNVLLANYLTSLGSDVKAWFDPTSDAYFTFSTGAQVSAWVSRIGAQTLSQATSANQPLRDVATSVLGGKNTLLFDGSNDSLGAVANPNFWKFLHDGTGYSLIAVLRRDSTGGATASLLRSASTNAQSGVHLTLNSASAQLSILNASGSSLNVWTISMETQHFASDVSRWQMFGYVDGTQHSRVSGSSLTNADAGGLDPSAANPSTTMLLGNGSGAYKGYVGDLIFLNHVATSTERQTITGLLAQKYGVAP
jgi:hypothetical protein